MAYSIKDIIFNGMTVKKYQEKALEQGKDFSPAMLNLSTWYYYSPAVQRSRPGFGSLRPLKIHVQMLNNSLQR